MSFLSKLAAVAATAGLSLTGTPGTHPIQRRSDKLHRARERCLSIRFGRHPHTAADFRALDAADLKRQRKGVKLWLHSMHWPQNRRKA